MTDVSTSEMSTRRPFAPARPPVSLLRQESDAEDVGAVVEDDPEAQEDEERAITCAECGHEITSDRHKTSMDGGFEHSFPNPAGIVYQIGCFEEAPGVGVTGSKSTEFTWFEGYAWQVAICRGCGLHLGWKYWSEDHQFFGLILSRLDGV